MYNSGWMMGFDAGLDAVTWQTLDDKGNPLPAGVYLTQVDVRGVDGTTKAERGSLQLDAAPASTTKDITPRATITGSGTANRIVLWTSDTTVGDSIITQTNSTILSVAGTINATAVNATNPNGNALVGNSKGGTALAGITQTGNGVLGTSTSAYGMRGVTGTGIGVRGDSNNSTIGVQGNSNAASSNGVIPVGVDGNANGGATSIGVRGTSTSGIGISGSTGSTATRASAIVGTITSTSPGADSAAVRGINNGTGSFGIGVYGSHAGAGWGVQGVSNSSYGIYGVTTTGVGIRGTSIDSSGYAGFFAGKVRITGDLTIDGTVSKSGGSFRIDDPLDPANKYLSHSFVESPDMMNIYNGNVITDKKGYATVKMPLYFSALNQEFRYQLTVVGTFAQAIVGEKIKGNQFIIRTDKPNVEVSWQVTGIRRDPWANDHRIPNQQLKTGAERGRYLYPAGYHKPASMGIDHLVDVPRAPKSAFKTVAMKPGFKHAPTTPQPLTTSTVKQPSVKPVASSQSAKAPQRVAQAGG